MLAHRRCARIASQGFGKRKNAVGMQRPKKKKVEVAECLAPATTDTSTGTTAAEDVSAATMADEMEDDELEWAKSEEKRLRKFAKSATAEQRKAVQELNVEVRKAEAALRHEQRLAEERERRWWAAERHTEPPPAYLQLERAYKSQVKHLQALLALSEAKRRVAVAESLCAELSCEQEKLRSAHLARVVRRTRAA